MVTYNGDNNQWILCKHRCYGYGFNDAVTIRVIFNNDIFRRGNFGSDRSITRNTDSDDYAVGRGNRSITGNTDSDDHAAGRGNRSTTRNTDSYDHAAGRGNTDTARNILSSVLSE